MTPTHIVMDDGTEVELVLDATGLSARHDGLTVYVSVLRSTPAAVSPAKWRASPPADA
jgi:hypothetical protein